MSSLVDYGSIDVDFSNLTVEQLEEQIAHFFKTDEFKGKKLLFSDKIRKQFEESGEKPLIFTKSDIDKTKHIYDKVETINKKDNILRIPYEKTNIIYNKFNCFNDRCGSGANFYSIGTPNKLEGKEIALEYTTTDGKKLFLHGQIKIMYPRCNHEDTYMPVLYNYKTFDKKKIPKVKAFQSEIESQQLCKLVQEYRIINMLKLIYAYEEKVNKTVPESISFNVYNRKQILGHGGKKSKSKSKSKRNNKNKTRRR